MDKKILIRLCIIFSIIIIITIALIIASNMPDKDSKKDNVTKTSSEDKEESTIEESEKVDTNSENKLSEEEMKAEIEEIKKKLKMLINLLVKKDLSVDEKKNLKSELGKLINLNDSDIDDEKNDYTSDPKIMKSLLDAFDTLLNALYSINPLKEENRKSYSGYYNRNVQPILNEAAEKFTRVKQAILDKTNYYNTEKQVTKKQQNVPVTQNISKSSSFGVFKDYLYVVCSKIADFTLYATEILRDSLPFSRYRALRRD